MIAYSPWRRRSCRSSHLLTILAAAALGVSVPMSSWAMSPESAELSPEVVRTAVEKSLALLEKTSREYRNHRECFSCHHQALPTLALVEARRRGLAIDAENLKASIALTIKHLENGREQYLKGRGQGGKADTAGYALWTLDAGGWRADATTAAVAEYLVSYPKEEKYWRCSSRRPPTEASHFTTSFLALRGLKSYAVEEQQERIAVRFDNARQWFLENKGSDTEDRVFRLRGLRLLDAEEVELRAAVETLMAAQRNDGGWAQTDDRESDPYAAGVVLAALAEAGGVSRDDPRYRRGVRYLLKTQLDDGSWRVVSRSDPFQTYFESGFPHGADQFISAAASSWATIALLQTMPERAISKGGSERETGEGRPTLDQ